MQVSYFVLYMSSPCLVGLAAEVNKTVKLSKLDTAFTLLYFHSLDAPLPWMPRASAPFAPLCRPLVLSHKRVNIEPVSYRALPVLCNRVFLIVIWLQDIKKHLKSQHPILQNTSKEFFEVRLKSYFQQLSS